jgi:hypothetical protein
VGVVLDAFKVINERRDLAFRMVADCGKCVDRGVTPFVIYWTNMVPLTVGLVIFLAVVTTIMIRIPHFVSLEDEAFTRRMVQIGKLISIPLVFTAIAFLLGGTFDFFYLVVQGRI